MSPHRPSSYFATLRGQIEAIKLGQSRAKKKLRGSMRLGYRVESVRRRLSESLQVELYTQSVLSSEDGVLEPMTRDDASDERSNTTISRSSSETTCTMRTRNSGPSAESATPEALPPPKRESYRGYHSWNSVKMRKWTLEQLEKKYVYGYSNNVATDTEAKEEKISTSDEETSHNVEKSNLSNLEDVQAVATQPDDPSPGEVLPMSPLPGPVEQKMPEPTHSVSTSSSEHGHGQLSHSNSQTSSRLSWNPSASLRTFHPLHNLTSSQRQQFWENLSGYTISPTNLERRGRHTWGPGRPSYTESEVIQAYLDSLDPETRRALEQSGQDTQPSIQDEESSSYSFALDESPSEAQPPVEIDGQIRRFLGEQDGSEHDDNVMPQHRKDSTGNRILSALLCRPMTCSPECSASVVTSRLPVRVGPPVATGGRYKLKSLTKRLCCRSGGHYYHPLAQIDDDSQVLATRTSNSPCSRNSFTGSQHNLGLLEKEVEEVTEAEVTEQVGELEGQARLSKMIKRAPTSLPSSCASPTSTTGQRSLSTPAHIVMDSQDRLRPARSLGNRLREIRLEDLYGMTDSVQQEIKGVLSDIERGREATFGTFPRRSEGINRSREEMLNREEDIVRVSPSESLEETEVKCRTRMREVNERAAREARRQIMGDDNSIRSHSSNLTLPRSYRVPTNHGTSQPTLKSAKQPNTSVQGNASGWANPSRIVESATIRPTPRVQFLDHPQVITGGHANGMVSRNRVPSPYPLSSNPYCQYQPMAQDDHDPVTAADTIRNGNVSRCDTTFVQASAVSDDTGNLSEGPSQRDLLVWSSEDSLGSGVGQHGELQQGMVEDEESEEEFPMRKQRKLKRWV